MCLYELYACIDNTLGTRTCIRLIPSFSRLFRSFPQNSLVHYLWQFTLKSIVGALVATIVDTVDSSTIFLEIASLLFYTRTRRNVNNFFGKISVWFYARYVPHTVRLTVILQKLQKKKENRRRGKFLLKNCETRRIKLKGKRRDFEIIRGERFLLTSLYEKMKSTRSKFQVCKLN